MKIYKDAAAALDGGLKDGITIMSGGFGLCGAPETLVAEVAKSGIKDLTVVSNNCGSPGESLWHLLKAGQIKKMIASYIGDNKLFEEKVFSKELELELVPQGTLAERMRAGGAGIPAFYTATGYGTALTEGKPTEVFDGKNYVLERWLRADVALVRAWKADPQGNLIYRKTARNFNPMMASAAKLTVVEVEEIVELGELDPDHIHTPGIFVDRIIQADPTGKIERRTERPREAAQ